MKITNARPALAVVALGATIATAIATPAVAAPTAGRAGSTPASAAARHGDPCQPGSLDPAPMRAAIAGLPTAEATSAQVRITTTAGCWTGTSGVTDLRTQHPVPADARFRVGSVTKVFTAAMVLQLAAEGRLDLDGSVQRYLPGLLPADYPTVTVRQLLNHTNGLPSPTMPDGIEWQVAHRYDRWTPEQIVRLGLRNPREFEPGTRQHYSNMGPIVAGMLIEKVTGHSYARELDRRIARPLGLRDTYAPGDDPRIRGPHVHGYQAVDRDGVTELVDATTWSQTFTPASGNIISTVANLDRFIAALFAGRVVPAAQLEEMFTLPAVEDVSGAPATYSAGLTAFPLPTGEVLWVKTGSRFGYLAAIAASRDGRFRLAYSVTSTDAKADGRPPIVDAIIGAAFAIR